MNTHALGTIATYLDGLLAIPTTPDYPPALNGIQVAHAGPVTKIAAAVDCSRRTIAGAAAEGANLLLVHHGLFWGGLQPLVGAQYARVRALVDADLALYSAHLPLDAHPTFGNSALLATALELEPSGLFAKYESIHCGVRGLADLATDLLVSRTRAWAAPLGHNVLSSQIPAGHRTRRWAICTGAGAQADTLRDAYDTSVDTLLVGEGPHWSAVEAEEHGLVIIYAGHYATETLGVRAVAAHLSETFGLPWTFVHAPTGL